jgi:hypothetical protein
MYNWQVNDGTGWLSLADGGSISGSSSAVLHVNPATTVYNHNSFRCIVFTGFCYDTTTIATLTVNCSPMISANPVAQTVRPGFNAGFGTASTDAHATYQWQSSTGGAYSNLTDGGNISGSHRDTLRLTPALASNDHTQFRCIVSNGFCTDTTTAAMLNSSCPALIASAPVSVLSHPGLSTTFSTSTHEAGVSFQWQASHGGAYTSLSDGGQFSGTHTANLSISSLTPANDHYYYRCILSTGYCFDTTSAALLSVNCNPMLSASPVSTTTHPGNSVSFSVSSLDPTVHYQWQTSSGSGFVALHDAGQYSGSATSTLHINPAQLSNDLQSYRCVLTNGLCADTSAAAVLSVYCNPAVTMQPADQIIHIGENLRFTVSSGLAHPSYQWQLATTHGYVNAIDTGGISGTTTTTLSVMHTNTSYNSKMYRCVISDGFCYDTTMLASASILCAPFVSTQPLSQSQHIGDDIQFTVTTELSDPTFQWQANPGFGYHNISDTDHFSGSNTYRLNIANARGFDANLSYRCVINSGYCSDTSNYASLVLACNPLIGTNPTTVNTNVGTTAHYTVSSPAADASYQWQKGTHGVYNNITDGGNYSGTSTPDLYVSSVAKSNDGESYRCVITMDVCTDTTSAALLNVNTTAINSVKAIDGFDVYPNPANDHLVISGSDEHRDAAFNFLDMTGRSVLQGRLSGQSTAVNINDLASGVYVIKIGESNKQSYRIVKN